MISAQDVAKLREETQAPVMECKKALEEAQGDFEKAKKLLEKAGKIRAEKKSEGTTKTGIVEAYIHSNKKVGVLLELRCETDFVSQNKDFQQLAHDLAMHIAAMNPLYISLDKIPEEVIKEKKEEYKKEIANKPPEIVEKIIQGKLEKELEEICLEKQVFIKDENKRVGDLIKEAMAKFGEKIEISRFVRFSID
ncbi:MAG: elongation factor Ts [Candidatus Paceibacterota bacterium]